MNRKRLSEEKHKSIMYNNRAILFYEIKGLSTKIVLLFVCLCAYVFIRREKTERNTKHCSSYSITAYEGKRPL
jgi:hypothetical protein